MYCCNTCSCLVVILESIYIPEESLAWDDLPVLPSKKIVKAQRRIFTKFISSTTVNCAQRCYHNESFLRPKREFKIMFLLCSMTVIYPLTKTRELKIIYPNWRIKWVIEDFLTPYLNVNRRPTNSCFGQLVVCILTMLLIINYLQLHEISVPKTVRPFKEKKKLMSLHLTGRSLAIFFSFLFQDCFLL